MQKAENRTCPACGGALVLEREELPLSGDGNGSIFDWFDEPFLADAYCCADCGRIELYKHRDNRAAEPERELVTCPVCGAEHDARIGCPRCAMNHAYKSPRAAQTDKQPPAEKRRPRGKKPPWER